MRIPDNTRRYLLFRNYKSIFFIHPPKCGGKYVENTFRPYIKQCPTLTLPAASGHKTWLEHRDIFREHHVDFENAQTFSVVRNPWDWHVSWYHYIKHDKDGKKSGHALEHRLFQKITFPEYIRWLEDPTAERSPQGYITKQVSDWFVDEQGNIAVDTVLRQESLEQDLRRFVEQNNLDIVVSAERKNSSERTGDYQEYYDNETADIIRKRHQRDIALFGYGF